MKILVTGGYGMLARDLIPLLQERGDELLAVDLDRLDITELSQVRDVANQMRPSLVINCAAYNSVDEAETQPDLANRVNGLGVQNLCLACLDMDIPLVHFSTDYVFGGDKEGAYTICDQTGPVSAYGRSKLLGEKYVLWLLNKFYLIRTSWLFGLGGGNFVETILKLSEQRDRLTVVNDQRGCPTWTFHLAQAVVALLDTGRYGVYHATNSEPTTWFDFAREFLRLSGSSTEVLPVATRDFPRPAKRPHNSVLDPSPLADVIGYELPSWRQAIAEYMALRKEAVGK